MLHSSYANKNTYEDPKTSAVFENLMLLPDNVFWSIIKNSCIDSSNLPVVAGRLLDYVFWPHWDSAGTNNANLVEPDLFLRFELFDVILEAKYGENVGQNEQQWRNEVASYYNEYLGDNKVVVFIAVGGNANKENEEIKVKSKVVTINKCSWMSLLMTVGNYEKELYRIKIADYSIESQKRIINNITLAFNINGVYNMSWFETLADINISINENSIDHLNNYFQYE